MSAKLHLCAPDALDRLEQMVAAFHDEMGMDSTPDARRASLLPLLEGSPYGAIYLIGPKNAPVGYLVVTFSWSIEFSGLDAMLDELWIRPAVRGRGMATEALSALITALKPTGVRAISLEAETGSPAAALYARLSFVARERYSLMTRML